MILDLVHGGNIFIQSLVSGWKQPLSVQQRLHVSSCVRDDYYQTVVSIDRQAVLAMMPGPSSIDQLRFSFEFEDVVSAEAHLSFVLVVEVSFDSTDGLDGDWNEMACATALPQPEIGMVWKSETSLRARWLRVKVLDVNRVHILAPLLARLSFFQIDGQVEPGRLVFQDRAGNPLDILDAGHVSVGGAHRVPFWVFNRGEVPLCFVLTVNHVGPDMKGRFWFVGEAGPTQRIEVGRLDPKVRIGPFYVEASPKPQDPSDNYRAYIRIAERTVGEIGQLE